jgi:thiol-disulfide isomerase/thioredoxin
MKNHFITIVLLALVAYIATPKIISMIKGPAETPTIFASGFTLEEAVQQSTTTGKPMLVLVTADWCPPCQSLKRGALTDPEVTQWVQDNVIPVYLEDGANPDAIRMLPVRSYPTTLVIQDGDIVGQFTGNRSASSFLSSVRELVEKS